MRRVFVLVLVAVLVLITACGGGGGGEQAPPPTQQEGAQTQPQPQATTPLKPDVGIEAEFHRPKRNPSHRQRLHPNQLRRPSQHPLLNPLNPRRHLKSLKGACSLSSSLTR